MLRRIDLTAASADVRGVLPRARVDVAAAIAVVEPIVNEVAERGYVAVREATLRFDGVDVATPRVPAAAIGEALAALDPVVRDAFTESIRRVRIGHEAQRRDRVDTHIVPGGTVNRSGCLSPAWVFTFRMASPRSRRASS